MGVNPNGKSHDIFCRNNPNGDSKNQHLIRKLGDLFNLLGLDAKQNIHVIVHQAYEIFDCACALYHRLNPKKNTLSCWSGSNLPTDFPSERRPKGSICFEATMKSRNQPVVIEDITQTPFHETDLSFAHHGFRSYLGFPVFCNGEIIGSLATIDTRVGRFDNTDTYLISTLAQTITLQEERLRIESVLNENQKEDQKHNQILRLMADNIPDLIWAKDMQDRYMFVNQSMCDKLIKCRQPEEAIGKTDSFFMERERESGFDHTFGENSANSDDVVKKKRAPDRFIEEGLVRNRHLVLDINKAPFWGPDGKLIGTVGCGRDVTKDRKKDIKVEQAPKSNERHYSDLYNNAPAMLCAIDANNIITSISNLWLEELGYERKDVIGQDILSLLTAESKQQALETSLPELHHTGRIKNHPSQFLTDNDEVKHIMLNAVSQMDKLGNYNGATIFGAAITKEKTTEIEDTQLSISLQQAQKMESIATLAGGIAHQFNNALAVIMGNLELIQMDGSTEDKLNIYVEPINQASQKMVQLTGQLLAYARGGKFQTETISAYQFVTETLKIVQHSMAPNMEVETDLDKETSHIEVDRTQMQMLLAAILSNASEAMNKKGLVRITLRDVDVTKRQCLEHPGLRPGQQVLLRISDNGKGMDEQTRDRIFEPFFTTKFQGRGLGMAAVYGIVKKHGGCVYVESDPRQGTTVSIYLPKAQAYDMEISEKITPYLSEAKSGTALIVEDEHLVLEVNRAIIEKLGYHVLEAKSGKEAIEITKQYDGKIDFVLLDVILPDMDGSLIYPELMNLRPELKVVVCSGFALDGPAKKILEAGAESFMQKPFTVAALSSVLKRISANEEE